MKSWLVDFQVNFKTIPGPLWQLKSHWSWFLAFWAGSCICREPRALHCRSQIPNPWWKYGAQKLPRSFQAPCRPIGSWDTENIKATVLLDLDCCEVGSQGSQPHKPQLQGVHVAALSLNTHSLESCLWDRQVSTENWASFRSVLEEEVSSRSDIHSKGSSIFCEKMTLTKLPATSVHLPFSTTWASAATKKEHSWPAWSLLSTSTHYAQPNCSSFIWKCDKELNSISDTRDLFFPWQ